MKSIISTDKVPSAIGPYSQGVAVGDFVYFSGQIPLLPTGELVDGDIKAQTEQVMVNIGSLLACKDMDFNNIVKTTIFLTDLNDFDVVNDVYSSYFEGDYPARSCVQVSALPKGVDIEIEIIAHA